MKSRYMKIAIILVFLLGFYNLGYVIVAIGLFLILVLWKKKESKKEETSDSHNEEN